jgi:transposase
MYTLHEYTDMILTYGADNENGREAQRLYAEKFPNRRQPHHSSFSSVTRRLRETGYLQYKNHSGGRPRSTRTVDFEENVLDMVEENPSTSTRSGAIELHSNHVAVWRVLREQQLHPYRIQKVQALNNNDFPLRQQFCQIFFQQLAVNPLFPTVILFTDEASFSRNGIINFKNNHEWNDENPHAINPSRHQHRFSLNIWCGIIGDFLIGPHVLPHRLRGQTYLDFLVELLPTLLEYVPLRTRMEMWYMHDGAPPHTSVAVTNFLNNVYPNRWIGNRGPIPWPARSPDLNPLDFFIMGAFKKFGLCYSCRK